MAMATFGSPIKKLYGETQAITTTASHVLVRPGYQEVILSCPSAWKLGLAPRLAQVSLYATTYTNYLSQAIDKVSTTHVPLDGMTTAKYLYLGTTEPTRGFYFNVDDTNKNDNAATLDWEYCYDIAQPGYKKLTGTTGAGFAVGLTTTGGTSGATGVTVYDGTTYVILKNITGQFALNEDLTDSSTGSLTAISAIDPVDVGTGYFTDVAGDSDGTNVSGDTLKQDGLYAFTLPSVVKGVISAISSTPLYWYRFVPSATLSNTVDLIDIIPACDTTNYAYMDAGVSYQFSLNTSEVGAFEVVSVLGTPTMNINWIQH